MSVRREDVRVGRYYATKIGPRPTVVMIDAITASVDLFATNMTTGRAVRVRPERLWWEVVRDDRPGMGRWRKLGDRQIIRSEPKP